MRCAPVSSIFSRATTAACDNHRKGRRNGCHTRHRKQSFGTCGATPSKSLDGKGCCKKNYQIQQFTNHTPRATASSLSCRGGAGSPYAQTSLPPVTTWLRNRGCQTAMTALVAGTRLRGRPHAVSTEALAEVGARAPVVERRMFVLGSAVFFLSRAAEYISSAWKRLRRPTLVSLSVHSNKLSFKAG